MAIVFIDQKRKKRLIVWVVVALSILILFTISLVIFPPIFKFQEGSLELRDGSEEVVIPPDININLGLLDSDRVKNLEPFLSQETEFTYFAQDKFGRRINGVISAITQEQAKGLLEKNGLKILNIQESAFGRKEPFAPYYQSKEQ